jgi:hypothetical protein
MTPSKVLQVLHVGKFYPPVPGMEQMLESLAARTRGIDKSRAGGEHGSRHGPRRSGPRRLVTRVAPSPPLGRSRPGCR